jgi:AraC family transcriptional regulator
MARKKAQQSQFHRLQIGRAQRYIRLHLMEPLHAKLSLARIAREAGSSSYHFARLFQAYVGETPFGFLRRLRVLEALRMLQEDDAVSVKEVAMAIGYDTAAAFNKAMRKTIDATPSEFRTMGKEKQDRVLYDLSRPRSPKETPMNLSECETVTRSLTHYAYLEKRGPFAEIAPPLWNELHPLLPKLEQNQIREFLGVSGIDKSKGGEDSMIYQAGVALASEPKKLPPGMQYRAIPSGRYARFVLTGPYAQIWQAFDQVFKTLAEKKVELRPEFCVENYLNDPRETPEEKLLTEILVPVA